MHSPNVPADDESPMFPARPATTDDYRPAFAWAEEAVAALEAYDADAAQRSPNDLTAEAQRRIQMVSDHVFGPARSDTSIPDTFGLGQKIIWELPGRRVEANIKNAIAWANVAVARAVTFAQTQNGCVTYKSEPRVSRRWWMERPVGNGMAAFIMQEAEKAYETAAVFVQGLGPQRSEALQPVIDALHAALRRIEPVTTPSDSAMES